MLSKRRCRAGVVRGIDCLFVQRHVAQVPSRSCCGGDAGPPAECPDKANLSRYGPLTATGPGKFLGVKQALSIVRIDVDQVQYHIVQYSLSNQVLVNIVLFTARFCCVTRYLDPISRSDANREGNRMFSFRKTLAPTFLAAALIAGSDASAFTACQVTDTGGIDDNSFNQTAWQGVLDAQESLGVEGRFLESQAETDYVANINSLVNGDCDIIITVGFLLGDATKEAAAANPDQAFSIVDYAYDPVIPNILGQVYATDEAAFLAGYVAAGVTKTGVLGTFGGINIPPVTIFMDGFYRGAMYYNAQNGTEVTVLGWNPETREGLFTNNFNSLDDGRAFAQNLYDEGADIVMPVAGPVGLGSASLANELGADKLMLVGVDADLYLTDPNNSHVYLTSVTKRMDATVSEVIARAMNGSFEGGVLVGTLDNGGVDLAPFHDMAERVPAELSTKLAAVRAGIIDGSINVGE